MLRDPSALNGKRVLVVGGIGSLPWAYAHASVAIMRHIQRCTHLGTAPGLNNLNYFDFVKFLATIGSGYYADHNWPESYVAMAFELAENPSNTLQIPPSFPEGTLSGTTWAGR